MKSERIKHMVLVVGLVGVILFWTYIGKDIADVCKDV